MDSCRFTKTGLTLGETRATENNPGESERNTSALKRGGSAGRSKGTPNKLTIACKAYGWPHLPTERYERRTAKEETLEVWEKDPSVHAFADLMNRTIDKPAEQPAKRELGQGEGRKTAIPRWTADVILIRLFPPRTWNGASPYGPSMEPSPFHQRSGLSQFLRVGR
jgi:hypothetical protein